MIPVVAFALRNWRIISIVVGIVALLGGAGIYIETVKHDAYVAGHTAGYSEAQAKCDAEKAAQEAANAKLIAEATKVLDDLQSKLQLKELQVDDILKGIDLAADADPGALGGGLGVDSVRRLNRAVE